MSQRQSFNEDNTTKCLKRQLFVDLILFLKYLKSFFKGMYCMKDAFVIDFS